MCLLQTDPGHKLLGHILTFYHFPPFPTYQATPLVPADEPSCLKITVITLLRRFSGLQKAPNCMKGSPGNLSKQAEKQ